MAVAGSSGAAAHPSPHPQAPDQAAPSPAPPAGRGSEHRPAAPPRAGWSGRRRYLYCRFSGPGLRPATQSRKAGLARAPAEQARARRDAHGPGQHRAAVEEGQGSIIAEADTPRCASAAASVLFRPPHIGKHQQPPRPSPPRRHAGRSRPHPRPGASADPAIASQAAFSASIGREGAGSRWFSV